MERIAKFKDFNQSEKECRWCYKPFKPKAKDETCCCRYCATKYEQYLANDEAQKPWDKFIEK